MVYHRNRRHYPKPPRWAESRIYTYESGCITHRQRENVGYGFTTLHFVGTLEQVQLAVEKEQRNYPQNGYGGRYEEPEDLGNGLYLVYARHSESCE